MASGRGSMVTVYKNFELRPSRGLGIHFENTPHTKYYFDKIKSIKLNDIDVFHGEEISKVEASKLVKDVFDNEYKINSGTWTMENDARGGLVSTEYAVRPAICIKGY